MDVALHVNVADGIPDTRVDQLSLQLAADIRLVSGLAVRQSFVQAEPGSKSSSAAQVGMLIISGLFTAGTVRAMRDVVLAFIERAKVRSVTIRTDRGEATIHGASKADLAAVTAQLAHVIQPDGRDRK